MAVSYARLHPKWRTILSNLPRVARNFGINYRITSAYRSPQKQAQLYAAYIRGESRYPAAKPGTSRHEYGEAIDIVSTNQPLLASIFAGAGVHWAGQPDPVHFQLTPLKSQTTDIFENYTQNVGGKIPAVLTNVPVIGSWIGAVRDPIQSLKKSEDTIWDIIFGFL